MWLRNGKINTVTVLLLLAIIVLGVALLLPRKHLSSVNPFGKTETSPTPTVAETKISLERPLFVKIRNIINRGQEVSPSSIDVLDAQGNTIDSLSYDSVQHAWIGTEKFPSGTTVYLKMHLSNGIIQVLKVSTPFYDKAVAEIDRPEYHEFTVYIPAVPTVAIKVEDSLGNVIAAGSTKNVTSVQETFRVRLINSAEDTGLPRSFYDPETRRHYTNIIVVKVSGAAVIPTWNILYSTASEKVYYMALKDTALDMKKDPLGNIVGGSYDTSFTVDTSGMASGQTATITIIVYSQACIDYARSALTMNADAVTLASFTFTIQKP